MGKGELKKRYLLIVLLVLSITSLFIGVINISPIHIFRLSDHQRQIIIVSRIPQLVSIIIAGVGLSISGLIMQQLTRNKFVSPTTAGTMDSARLGVLVAMLFFASSPTIVKILVAFIFALLGTLLFMRILEKVKYKDVIFIPLVGLMFGSVVGSITTFFALRNDMVQNMSSWLQGNFSLIIRGRYELIYISIPLVIIAYIYANKFTVAGMGEDFSINLGLNYQKVVRIGLVIVAAITSIVLLTVGMIPFLGLIIPNIVSIYNGDNLKKNLSQTAFEQLPVKWTMK